MKLDCQITEILQRDFNSLWKCKILGETLEITTPYLLPDSTLFSLFLTERSGRYIACDGGSVWEILKEYCSLPEREIEAELAEMAQKFQVKTGEKDEAPLFFKECSEPKLISSIAFDVANFAVMTTSALVSAGTDEPGIPPESRFERKVDRFLHDVVPRDFTFLAKEIPEVSGFRFGAVLERRSNLWLISFVTGSTATYFRKSVNDVSKSFQHAWESSLARGHRLRRTIPIVNTDARGYDKEKLSWQLGDLRKDSRESVVEWDQKEEFADFLKP